MLCCNYSSNLLEIFSAQVIMSVYFTRVIDLRSFCTNNFRFIKRFFFHFTSNAKRAIHVTNDVSNFQSIWCITLIDSDLFCLFLNLIHALWFIEFPTIDESFIVCVISIETEQISTFFVVYVLHQTKLSFRSVFSGFNFAVKCNVFNERVCEDYD